MRIKRIHVKNFKSLVDFTLDFEKFTCLVGLNGAGKTTVLQFLDFLSQLAKGRIDEWLERREWVGKELVTPGRRTVAFDIILEAENEFSVIWSGSFNTVSLRCSVEEFRVYGKFQLHADESLVVGGGKYWIYEEAHSRSDESDQQSVTRVGPTPKSIDISWEYQGSILSVLKESILTDGLMKVRDFFQSIHSLELMSPQLLRKRSRDSTATMGPGGEKLASFLKGLTKDQMSNIERQLRSVYPHLRGLKVKTSRFGWKQLDVTEKYGREELVTNARHVNDGFLRMLAIMAELQSPHEFLIFDEIENGVNPELVEFVLDTLCNARQQVLVTTHSPLILNYLDDEVARAGVMYLYKTKQGATKAVPFFSIPSAREKLTVMGPGEVYADTILSELDEEIRSLPTAGE